MRIMTEPKPNDSPYSDDEFEKLLKTTQDKERDAAFFVEFKEMVDIQINFGLVEHGVASVIDAQGQPREDIINTLRMSFADYLFETEGIAYDSPKIDDLTKFTVAMDTIEEAGLFSRIALHTIPTLWQPLTLEQSEVLDTDKRLLIAEWVIKRHLPVESEWVTFLNDVVPGAYASSDDIAQAMIAVIDATPQEEDFQLRAEAARNLARIEADYEALLREHPEYELDLQAPTLMNATGPDFDAQVDEVARKLGTTRESVLCYVEVYKRNMPQ